MASVGFQWSSSSVQSVDHTRGRDRREERERESEIERERESERASERGREGGRERERHLVLSPYTTQHEKFSTSRPLKIESGRKKLSY